mmetsp:Transcript_27491/g.42654  ORF Transcript_27491/g.42654 Transcript_27491/m.42654 type:complete len:203 (+) Transcript_27491:891-1499(+)
MLTKRDPAGIATFIFPINRNFTFTKTKPSKINQLIQSSPISQSIFATLQSYGFVFILLSPTKINHSTKPVFAIYLFFLTVRFAPRVHHRVGLRPVIIMIHIRCIGSINIVPMRKEPRGTIELLPIKNMRCMRIHLRLEIGMTFGETQPRTPNSIRQLGPRQSTSALGRMRADVRCIRNHTQMRNLLIPINIRHPLHIIHVGG